MAVGATHIRVLGSFELVREGQVVPVNGRVGQAILTALACRPDTKVLPAQLISMVWGRPDAVSADTLYHHVTGLRRVLAPVGLVVVGHRPGYRLPVAPDQVDVVRFDELLRTSRALSASDPDQAAEGLRAALALWRGPNAVENLTQPGIRLLAAGWEARRLDAEEDLAEIDLRRGRPDQVLDRLHTLAADHPRRPRLTAALVRALHATGRTEQAGTVLATAERVANSGGDVVHPALVRARQALARPGSPTRSEPAAVVPFQLPADTVRFTGRAEQVSHLMRLRPDGPATVVVTAVEGMAGIGKTALAVHAAHRLADRFPDGVLFTDLCGFTPGVDPAPPDQVLGHLLRGLGVPGTCIPPDLEGRAGLYRSVLARRQVLIVLDNAAHETQLQPLLPATAGCGVIVTSRRRLAGLDEATHLTLPVLSRAEGCALFHAVAGDRIGTGDQVTVERIVRLCGGLPMAIRIAAARLRLAPAGSPMTLCAELVEALADGRGMDWLSDGHRAVGAALAVSYQHLTPDQQHVFCLTGLHPGLSLEPYAVAALADSTVTDAGRLLEDLYAASLLHQPTHRRYNPHDLVAAYVATMAAGLPEPDRHAALDRLYDHYAATSTRAANLTRPWEADQRRKAPTAHTPAPALSDDRDAQTWLDTETDNLLAAAHHAATIRSDHTLHQSATLRRHLRNRGHYGQAALLHEQALALAVQAGDRSAEQDALNSLGTVHYVLGRHGQATDCFERASASACRSGDRHAEQDALRGLGHVHFVQGRYEPAAGCFQRALAGGNHTAEQEAQVGLGNIHYVQGRYEQSAEWFRRALEGARQTGDRKAEHNALMGVGYVHLAQGRYEAAVDCLERTLAYARETGNPSAEQDALIGLGQVHLLQCRHESAAGCFSRALESAHRSGDSHAAQDALRSLGQVHHAQGAYERSADSFLQALTSARQNADRNGQFEAHQGLGRVHHATGNDQDALHHHRTALQLATDLDQPADQARAHDGLACAHHALGQPHQARQHWQSVLDLLTAIGTDYTEETGVTTVAVRAHLLDLGDSTTPG